MIWGFYSNFLKYILHFTLAITSLQNPPAIQETWKIITLHERET